jgi:hypothetical protein
MLRDKMLKILLQHNLPNPDIRYALLVYDDSAAHLPEGNVLRVYRRSWGNAASSRRLIDAIPSQTQQYT